MNVLVSKSSTIFLAWLIFMVALAMLYLTVPPSPDQSQFDWMAYIAIQGQPFYSGSFDMNWPGAIWLHEIGIRIFGIHAWTWRLTDFLLMIGFTVSGAILFNRAGWKIAPFVFVFLYPPLYVTAGGWMAGERDIIATGFLLIACALAIPKQRGETIAVLISGLLVAMAVLIRPTFLSFLFGLVALEFLPLRFFSPRQLSPSFRAICFGVGFLSVMLVVFLVGLVLGNLDDWYQQSIQFSFSVYVGEPAQDWRVTFHTLFIRSWGWITLLAAFGLSFWASREHLSYSLMLMLGLAATSVLSFVVQNKGFGYHLGGVLTVLVLFSAACFEGLIELRKGAKSSFVGSAALVGVVMASIVAVAGTVSKIMNYRDGIELLLNADIGPTDGHGLTEVERRAIIDTIRLGSNIDDTMVVYGTNFELAYRAERLPTYRFINVVLDQANASFPHYADWLAEINGDLAQSPPKFVVLQRRYLIEGSEPPEARFSDRKILTLLVSILVEGAYEQIFKNENVVVYRAPSLSR